MSDKKYTLPGMVDWAFDYPILQHKGGAGFLVTSTTPPEEIADAVKRIMRGTTWTPDEAAIELVAQASMNINWKALLDPFAVLVAPLLNNVPTNCTPHSMSSEQFDSIYRNMENAYYTIKAFDNRFKPA